MSLLGRLVLAVTRRRLVRKLFTARGWGRRVATRFVAGESLDDAVRVTRELNARGFLVSLDHLGEHVSDARLAAQARDHYLACIERIAAEGPPTEMVGLEPFGADPLPSVALAEPILVGGNVLAGGAA